MQSKQYSLYEAIANAILGYIVGVLSQMVILPLFNIHGVSLKANMGMAAMFMVTSIIRGYFVRRLFNRITKWVAQREKRN